MTQTTQQTQFLMVKGTDAINVQPSAVATYVAAGYRIVSMNYSEAGEGVDVTSQVLMVKGSDAIYVHPGSVPTYVALGYVKTKILYGASQTVVSVETGPLGFLDTPAFGSAEIGAVADTTVVVTFTTEITASNYATGVTITVDSAPVEIASATRQSDHTKVRYVIPAVTAGQVVLWSYDDATGLIESEVDGSPLDDVVDGAVTNTVA